MYKRSRDTRGRPRKSKRVNFSKSKSRNRALTKKIESVVLKTAEKHTVGSLHFGHSALAETAYLFPLSEIPIHGALVADHKSRVGQEVVHTGVQIKGVISNAVDESGVAITTMYRLLILETSNHVGSYSLDTSVLAWKGPDGNNVTTLSILGLAASMTYKLDPAYYHTLVDRVYTLGNTGNGRNSKIVEINKYWKKKIKFSGNSTGDYLQDRQIFMVLFAFCPRDTQATYSAIRYEMAVTGLYRDP